MGAGPRADVLRAISRPCSSTLRLGCWTSGATRAPRSRWPPEEIGPGPRPEGSHAVFVASAANATQIPSTRVIGFLAPFLVFSPPPPSLHAHYNIIPTHTHQIEQRWGNRVSLVPRPCPGKTLMTVPCSIPVYGGHAKAVQLYAYTAPLNSLCLKLTYSAAPNAFSQCERVGTAEEAVYEARQVRLPVGT